MVFAKDGTYAVMRQKNPKDMFNMPYAPSVSTHDFSVNVMPDLKLPRQSPKPGEPINVSLN